MEMAIEGSNKCQGDACSIGVKAGQRIEEVEKQSEKLAKILESRRKEVETNLGPRRLS